MKIVFVEPLPASSKKTDSSLINLQFSYRNTNLEEGWKDTVFVEVPMSMPASEMDHRTSRSEVTHITAGSVFESSDSEAHEAVFVGETSGRRGAVHATGNGENGLVEPKTIIHERLYDLKWHLPRGDPSVTNETARRWLKELLIACEQCGCSDVVDAARYVANK